MTFKTTNDLQLNANADVLHTAIIVVLNANTARTANVQSA
jgi:hypothetical protein